MADMMERETTKNELYSAIDRLRAQNERLREALTVFVETCDKSPPVGFISNIAVACAAARTALQEPAP